MAGFCWSARVLTSQSYLTTYCGQDLRGVLNRDRLPSSDLSGYTGERQTRSLGDDKARKCKGTKGGGLEEVHGCSRYCLLG